MRKFSTHLLVGVVLVASFSVLAETGGFVVGSGGEIIQCENTFNSCDVVKADTSVECVTVNFQNPVMQEFFVARLTATTREFDYMKQWAQLNYDQTINQLMSQLRVVDFYPAFRKLTLDMGDIRHQGVAVNNVSFDPLNRIMNDAYLPFNMPAICQQHLAVYRSSGGGISYQEQWWNKLALNREAQQQALLQMHEWLYQFAKQVRGQKNSANTQSLIVALLQKKMSANELQNLVYQLGFTNKKGHE